MFNTKIWDVIIVGGGPAGLSLGSELSQGHEVLVVDKGKVGKTTKAWASEKRIIEENDIDEFVTAKFKESCVHGVSNKMLYVDMEWDILDDSALLNKWKNSILDNHSKILDHCLFVGHTRKDTYTLVYTTRGVYKCKLLIDCSGFGSKIKKGYFPELKPMLCPVYGGIYILENVPETMDIVLGGIMFENTPLVYYEVFPVSDHSFVFSVFKFINEYEAPRKLKKEYKRHLEKYIDRNGLKIKKRKRVVSGVIPMGSFNKNSVDGVFFFGDTSLIGSPFSATGFTYIMKHYKRVAAHLTKCLDKNSLAKKSLQLNYSHQEELNRDLGHILGVFLSTMNAAQYELLLKSLHEFSPTVFRDFLFLSFSPEEIFHVLKIVLVSLGPKDVYRIMPKNRIAEMCAKLIEVSGDMLLCKVEKLWKEGF